MVLSRREFLEDSAVLLAVAGLASGCATTGSFSIGRKSVEETLQPENYARYCKGWDSLFGPDLSFLARYGGRSDFQGHKRDNRPSPGLDYDVKNGTPIIPAVSHMGAKITRGTTSGLVLKAYTFTAFGSVDYRHLDDVIVDERYDYSQKSILAGEPLRLLTRKDIIAISGNSGEGPREYGGIQKPHLHFNVYLGKSGSAEIVDPEKYGLDGGRPIFWDGETLLEVYKDQKIGELEKRLSVLRNELAGWPAELNELKGQITDYLGKMGDVKGNAILDNKHFQDIRSLLKELVFRDRKFVAGDKPYSLMTALVAYSMVPPYSSQKIILTVPFIAPSLAGKGIFREPVYNEGPFYSYKDGKYQPVQKK